MAAAKSEFCDYSRVPGGFGRASTQVYANVYACCYIPVNCRRYTKLRHTYFAGKRDLQLKLEDRGQFALAAFVHAGGMPYVMRSLRHISPQSARCAICRSRTSGEYTVLPASKHDVAPIVICADFNKCDAYNADSIATAHEQLLARYMPSKVYVTVHEQMYDAKNVDDELPRYYWPEEESYMTKLRPETCSLVPGCTERPVKACSLYDYYDSALFVRTITLDTGGECSVAVITFTAELEAVVGHAAAAWQKLIRSCPDTTSFDSAVSVCPLPMSLYSLGYVYDDNPSLTEFAADTTAAPYRFAELTARQRARCEDRGYRPLSGTRLICTQHGVSWYIVCSGIRFVTMTLPFDLFNPRKRSKLIRQKSMLLPAANPVCDKETTC